MGLFGNDATVRTTFVGDDKLSPVVRNIRKAMGDFKRDAITGFGLGAGLNIFNSAQRAIGAVVDVLGDAVTAAREEELSVAKLTTAIEANAKGWDGNVAAIEDVLGARMRLGFADDEQRDSLARLVAATGDVTEALDIQRTAMDLSRLRGMSLADASELLGKVWGGNVGILKRYGIAVEKGTTSTQALAKVQRQAGGQAEAWAKKSRAAIADVRIGEAMEKVGAALLPVVENLADFAGEAVPNAIQALGNLGDAFNDLHRFLDPTLAVEQDLNDILRDEAMRLGLNADALLAYRAAQVEAAEAVSRHVDEQRMRQAAIDEYTQSLQGLQFTEQEIADRTAAYVRILDEEAAATVRVTDATAGYALAKDKAAAIIVQFLQAGMPVPPLLRDIATAVGAAGDGFAGAADDIGGSTADIVSSVAEMVPALRQELREMKTAAREGMADVRWGMEHPFAGDRMAKVLEGRIQTAQRLMTRANRRGWTVQARDAANYIRRMAGYAAELNGLDFVVSADFRPGHVPVVPTSVFRRPGRASGGPVGAGEAYTVGERGPETLVMGGQAGHVVPNGGGQPIQIYLDGKVIWDNVNRRMGREIAMNGSYG